jgi:RNA polymerase sigma factor (TIGR02999 family)
MTSKPMPLPQANTGDLSSDASFDDVYERLKALAHRQLGGGRRDTLDTTALVHELYLRMHGGDDKAFAKSGQFFAYAARAMRHLLIDRARARQRQKTGGDWLRVTFTGNAEEQPAFDTAEQVLALEQALEKLEIADARAAQVVELRYFAGLSPEQVAILLDLTRRTVDRDWRYALAFLQAQVA